MSHHHSPSGLPLYDCCRNAAPTCGLALEDRAQPLRRCRLHRQLQWHIPIFVCRDVFRFPPQRNLFCAFVGTGTQLLGLAVAIFGLACMNLFYPYNRWALVLVWKSGSTVTCCNRCDSGGVERTIHLHGLVLPVHDRRLAVGLQYC